MTIGSWKNRTTWDVLTLFKNQCDNQPIPSGDRTYHGFLFFLDDKFLTFLPASGQHEAS